MIKNAAKIALEKIIGKRQEAWKKFQAIVISAEAIGSVGIQELEKQSPLTEEEQNQKEGNNEKNL